MNATIKKARPEPGLRVEARSGEARPLSKSTVIHPLVCRNCRMRVFSVAERKQKGRNQ